MPYSRALISLNRGLMYLAVSALALAGLDVRTRLVDTLCDGRHLAVEHSEGLLQRSFESVFVLAY